MMNRFLNRLPLTFFALTVVITVLSWVGNVYEWGVNNLLCADGIRWAVERDANLKAKAAQDIEFAKYTADEKFQAIVK